MADYNVNMKQWNGSSFDNVLPLAYNAKQLEGQSLAEVKQWVQDNGMLLYTGQYVGTGTFGVNNVTSITFPFTPILLSIQPAMEKNDDYNIKKWNMSGLFSVYGFSSFVATHMLNFFPDGQKPGTPPIFESTAGEPLYGKFNSSHRVLSMYGVSARGQFNISDVTYNVVAIGKANADIPIEEVITESGNYIVPKTGQYYLELYGGGGVPGAYNAITYAGGSSCQSYTSITLTEGDVIPVTIGVRGEYISSNQSFPTATAGTGTTFGEYSVGAGGQSSSSSGGSAAGNKGANGKSSSSKITTNTSGVLYKSYGFTYGSGVNVGSYGYVDAYAGSGAVYLKYLGA